ncbi:hypothetical protein [Pseudoalteromonas marina]|uniref:RiboL-PSP-HEPN domain-containing protein n=1 Tax=Pseudoalteromonas marina TaxID=267375 RepID=A0ABT9FBY9_9GAMM|nr:hypothetical protein [Pseudoalteromonas marina]MDP2564297.1 hypothetical protein [Pseudoalteromonas marina]
MKNTFQEFLHHIANELDFKSHQTTHTISACESALKIAKIIEESKEDDDAIRFEEIWCHIGKLFILCLQYEVSKGVKFSEFSKDCLIEISDLEKDYTKKQQIELLRLFSSIGLSSDELSTRVFFRLLKALKINEQEIRLSTIGLTCINKHKKEPSHLKDTLLGALYTTEMKADLNDTDEFTAYLLNEISNFEVKLIYDHYRIF